MILFSTGIVITEAEYKCLLHVEADPERWLRDTLWEKARLRRGALIDEWQPRLLADPGVTTLPADADALVALILARPDYRSRAQADAESTPPVLPYRRNIGRFQENIRRGANVTLFPSGIDIPDWAAACILASVQDLEDWVLGALLGHINRGKKKMMRQYLPVLMADPSVASFPAAEDELMPVITIRNDYLTLPQQPAKRQANG